MGKALSTVPNPVGYVLFPTVKESRRVHTEIALRLLTDHSDKITKKLLDGLTDMSILYIPRYPARLEVIRFRKKSLYPTVWWIFLLTRKR